MPHALTPVVAALTLLSVSASVSTSSRSPKFDPTSASSCSEWLTLYEANWMKLPECHIGASTTPCCELYDYMDKSIRIFSDKLGCKFIDLRLYQNKFSVHCTSSGRIPGPSKARPDSAQVTDDTITIKSGTGGCQNCGPPPCSGPHCGGGCHGSHCGCTTGNCHPPKPPPCTGSTCCPGPYCKPPPCSGSHCGRPPCSSGHCNPPCSGSNCGCVGRNCGNPVGACQGINCGCSQCFVSGSGSGSGTDTGGQPNQGQPIVIPPDDDNDVCFHGNGLVKLQDGTLKLMKHLNVGDVVHVGRGKFSQVFMFTHQDPNKPSTYVNMTVGTGEWIMVTPTHYMYSDKGIQLASDLKQGDTIEMDDGRMEQIVLRNVVRDKGLFNPQTVHGDVAVNGFRASTYTRTIKYETAHSLLAPLRAMYRICGAHISSAF